MKRAIYILLGALVLIGILWGVADYVQKGQAGIVATLRGKILEADKDAEKARQERDEANAVAAEDHQAAREARQQAERAEARAQVASGKVSELEARLGALGPQGPVTDPTTLPASTGALAQAFTDAGFKPVLLAPPAELAFRVDQGRPMLGLLRDGAAYPQALLRIDLLTQDTQQLHEQVGGLTDAVAKRTLEADKERAAAAASATAEAAAGRQLDECKAARGALEGIITEDAKTLKVEKKKKWMAGGAGLLLGLLIGLL